MSKSQHDSINVFRGAFCALTVLFMIGTGLLAAEPKSGDEKWVSLFNGKDLDGWTPKIKGYALNDNHGNTFRVEDGVLKVRYDQYERFDGKFGHLFYKEPFSHYRLRVEYRFVGEQVPGGPGWALRNNGVMLHCQPPETMGLDQNFPVSVEGQLLGGPVEGERSTMNLCTPGTNIVMDGELIRRHCTGSSSQTYRGDQWVTVEFEVHGNGKIKHIIDGQVVLEFEKTQLDSRDSDAKALMQGGDGMVHGGYISLQAESHPCDFRKVEILQLEE